MLNIHVRGFSGELFSHHIKLYSDVSVLSLTTVVLYICKGEVWKKIAANTLRYTVIGKKLSKDFNQNITATCFNWS